MSNKINVASEFYKLEMHWKNSLYTPRCMIYCMPFNKQVFIKIQFFTINDKIILKIWPLGYFMILKKGDFSVS